MGSLTRLKVILEQGDFNYGDFVTLKKNSEVVISGTSDESPPIKIINDGKLWAVDYYEPETGMVNINRVLDPYPGAYCRWTYKSNLIRSIK